MRGRPMAIDALGPLKEKLEAPRVRARCPDKGESKNASLAPPRGQPSTQYCMSARAIEPMAAPRQEAPPPATQTAAAIGNYVMHTPSQRKLNSRTFDGTELYKGLGSGFFNLGTHLHARREPR
ncbi:unnamed protein product [Peronospora farinosa]|uniref:Uncharacterized protein n=1 Tax=Peronospora farinosa TaxID=134698 RepID=A0AAV0UHN7_9STRA|nr:unnamed protein product [Peronospora farinosa]CAI5735838.1 unnamed protein product [Peronospora farinosa]